MESDLKVVVPKTINRYKRQGSGIHFVHGGSSLQELVVPVVESNRKRENVSERVPFKLLNKEFKIVSGAIKKLKSIPGNTLLIKSIVYLLVFIQLFPACLR